MSRLFGPVRQSGYVVRDIEAAMRRWIDVLGVGPWYYFRSAPISGMTFRGKPIDLDLSVALANSGEMQVELIQQRNSAPSMYTEFLESGGEGLQHHAYWTHDFDASYAQVRSLGYEIISEGGGNASQGQCAFFETGLRGVVVEISGLTESKERFFDLIRESAVDWDGSDPIRPVGEL